MSKLFSHALRSGLIRMVMTGLFVVVGVAGGVYVGNSLAEPAPALPSLPIQGVHLDVGSAFPNEPAVFADGSETSFSTVIGDDGCILIFTSLSCQPCLDLIDYWNNVVARYWQDMPRTVFCIGNDNPLLSAEDRQLLGDFPVVIYDRDVFIRDYRMWTVPTIVAVDKTGRVKAIQQGFNGSINPNAFQ